MDGIPAEPGAAAEAVGADGVGCGLAAGGETGAGRAAWDGAGIGDEPIKPKFIVERTGI